MLRSSTTYHTLLHDLVVTLSRVLDPDSHQVRQMFLVVAHAATAITADGSAAEDWNSYDRAVRHALRTLEADLGDQVQRPAGLPPVGVDTNELRQLVGTAVVRLADLYAEAASEAAGSRWRRFIWSRVTHYLEDAAAELD